MAKKEKLSAKQIADLLTILQTRFEKNMKLHKGLEWKNVLNKLQGNADKLWSLHQMEETGGEPDVVAYDKKTDEYVFFDCSAETPKGRRSICYDPQALESRKEFKPKNSAIGMANEMGVQILDEEQYQQLQQLGNFDTKTSSWLLAPAAIRKLGGAIFGDKRYNTVFIYHNGAESYYAGRGFRASIKV